MDGSSSRKERRSIVLNHNGLEDEEEHDSTDSDTEDEESPPQLLFTDGSCSDSQLSQDSVGTCSSPCGRMEDPASLASQDFLSDALVVTQIIHLQDDVAEENGVDADITLQLGIDVVTEGSSRDETITAQLLSPCSKMGECSSIGFPDISDHRSTHNCSSPCRRVKEPFSLVSLEYDSDSTTPDKCNSPRERLKESSSTPQESNSSAKATQSEGFESEPGTAPEKENAVDALTAGAALICVSSDGQKSEDQYYDDAVVKNCVAKRDVAEAGLVRKPVVDENVEDQCLSDAAVQNNTASLLVSSEPSRSPISTQKEEEHAQSVIEPSTFVDDVYRDEVDMEVSSGGEDEEYLQLVKDSAAEEKRRIEENIQALLKEFERKRLEEKAKKALEAVSDSVSRQMSLDVVSTTSEEPPVARLENASAEGVEDCSPRSSGQIIRGPTTPANSPILAETESHTGHCESTTEEPSSTKMEKDDVSCELPSSSVEVPPVPPYEEIEQCIYKVENKKKALSLMCFCRGNNLDCSDSRCDNRAMFTECPKSCLGKGKDCRNRRFAKREYAAVQAFYTGPNKGFGVQAVAPIKKGQFIIEYVGEVVSSEEFAKRLKRYGRDPSHTHHYMFEIGSMIIDATKKGNCSRFMNHSCEPNAVCEKWYVPRTPCAIDRIGFFANRDIELGEEITFDYQFENYGREAQRCFCGAPSCTGWIGKPPEFADDDGDDDDIESPSEESEESAEEELKPEERVAHRRKKLRRFNSYDNVTTEEIEKRLCKALRNGCRNRTHVLGWIKLMTEMALIKRENGIVTSMGRIVEAISSVDTSLQYIFVANGLPSIFKSWLRISTFENLTREDLDLKHCIIRTLLTMQSCADAINARTPDLLSVVTELVAMPIPDLLSVKDSLENIVCQVSGEQLSSDLNLMHESLELRFERVRNAAIRLQAVLQQHVNFRIPKKKAVVTSPTSCSSNLLEDGSDRPLSSDGSRTVFRFHDRNHRFAGGTSGSVFRRLSLGIGGGRPRFRVSRWSDDHRPQKRFLTSSTEPEDECVIRCKIGPNMSLTSIVPERPPSSKKSRTAAEEPPIIVTTVRPNIPRFQEERAWTHPAMHPPIPPPPAPHIVSPSPVLVPPPPPPPTIPTVYAAAAPYYDYAPYTNIPPVPAVPTYAAPCGSYPQTPVENYAQPAPENGRVIPAEKFPHASFDDFDSEDCRNYYQSCDVSSLQSRLQILMKEVEIIQAVLDEKSKEQKKESWSPSPCSPAIPKTPQPPTPRTPPPPPHKEYMWRKAVDEDGAKYYYHKETRESVWELPDGEESDPGERTPTRMPDTSGCGNDTESDAVEGSASNAGLGVTPVMSTLPTHAQSDVAQSGEKKRDRLWDRFGNDDRKRAKKLMGEIEKVVGPIIVRHIGDREDATQRKKEWIIKQVSKEMLKRESGRADFNFTLTEKGSKRVTDYADAFIQRKCAKDPKDLWKGYDGSP